MIEQVRLKYFKRFREEVFDVSDNIILAGANNSGKSTLLQAIAVWNLGLRKWLAERGPESRSKAKKRTGVAVIRKDFTAIPLREMNLLWTDRSTALSKDELQAEQKLGTPRVLEIELNGRTVKGPWSLALEFIYRYPDLIHVRPAERTPVETILETIKNVQVVHVPPFSGIGVEETHYDQAYQDLLIGQGKPGDVLRNQLLEVYRSKPEKWDELYKDIRKIFDYELLPPVYEGLPYIVCEYRPNVSGEGTYKSSTKLDICSAGSGFLQVLMLLGFFYARPASILLLDEPDAHLHVVLQNQVYDRLREIARKQECQLLIATHSEVLVDRTSPSKILSFFQKPHRLMTDIEREQVREALKRLSSLDLLMAEQAPGVLYVEGPTDLDFLREWAYVLEHPCYDFLAKSPFWHSNQGRNPREAKGHFFALRAVNPNQCGILMLDGDNRNLPDHELSAEGLIILRWKRYEAESYLIHPEALARFIRGQRPDLFAEASVREGLEYLRKQLPPAIFDNPLADHDYLNATPASKKLLPGFFSAVGLPLSRDEYYQIAKQMLPEEIPQEVTGKLDFIYETLKPKNNP